jgi:putative SOS response-associated peptidase YedK
MCFTVNVNLIKEELENRYGATLIDPDKYRPSYYYHAFGLPEIPAVCSTTPDKIRLLKWGLIPSWTRSLADANEIRYKTFNARAESIEKKPSYSVSVKSRRCIIPVRGFYEWQHSGKDKIPWYIYHSENDIMSLAGLFDEWTDSSTSEIYATFTVITTDANELMAEIHNSAKRMPVILDREGESGWINQSLGAGEAVKYLKACPSEFLKAHTISPLISSRTADKNSPEVIKPYSYSNNNLLF